jgi:hypothetical protein
MMPRQYECDMVLTCVGHLYGVVHVAIHSAEQISAGRTPIAGNSIHATFQYWHCCRRASSSLWDCTSQSQGHKP